MHHLTATGLAQAANRLLESRGDTFAIDPERFTARTVYYYTRAGVLPRIRGVRKAERYPADWAERMVFARRMQQTPPGPLRSELTELVGVDPTTLDGIARVLSKLSLDRMYEIAEGSSVRQLMVPGEKTEEELFGEGGMFGGTEWTRLDTGPNLEIRIRSQALARAEADQIDTALNLLEKALM